MDKFHKLLQEIVKEKHLHLGRTSSFLTIEVDLTSQGVTVKFSNGRLQRITVLEQGEYYKLISVVLRKVDVESKGRAEILPTIWQRNRDTNLVAFSLDKRGRLIGCIEQLIKTADVYELRLYIETLARECDQLEYFLSGTAMMEV